jgi:hypothetical protein
MGVFSIRMQRGIPLFPVPENRTHRLMDPVFHLPFTIIMIDVTTCSAPWRPQRASPAMAQNPFAVPALTPRAAFFSHYG